jgi:hypothetical protein
LAQDLAQRARAGAARFAWAKQVEALAFDQYSYSTWFGA